jgi:hypothetical protein
VTLFDQYAQGSLLQTHVVSGQSLGVTLGGSQAQAIQALLTSPFGFVDFFGPNGSTERLALPVAIAETAGGQNNATAIARMRQDGKDSTTLTFYRVDNFNGDINGIHPDESRYVAAAQGRAYQLSSGGTSINGPGYGNWAQTQLLGINAGDLVAMTLTDTTHGNTFWAFAQGNESVSGQHVGHLWNYGLNTWGWEDTLGGGDRDYNDLVVGLDFTSASGSGWLK